MGCLEKFVLLPCSSKMHEISNIFLKTRSSHEYCPAVIWLAVSSKSLFEYKVWKSAFGKMTNVAFVTYQLHWIAILSV